ncbi:hypothetical protein ACWDRB_29660 [Nonomuraea sp. NPDC003707]
MPSQKPHYEKCQDLERSTDHPTQDPLITREMYDATQTVSRVRNTSRAGSEANRHPQTRRTYKLRSFVHCDPCDRRMFGQTETRRKAQDAYYCCQPDRNNLGREDRFPGHPKVVRVREDVLLDAVHDLFQRRIFGHHRHRLLAADLPETIDQAQQEWESRCQALKNSIAELAKKHDRITVQVDESDADDAFARRLLTRYSELEHPASRRGTGTH